MKIKRKNQKKKNLCLVANPTKWWRLKLLVNLTVRKMYLLHLCYLEANISYHLLHHREIKSLSRCHHHLPHRCISLITFMVAIRVNIPKANSLTSINLLANEAQSNVNRGKGRIAYMLKIFQSTIMRWRNWWHFLEMKVRSNRSRSIMRRIVLQYVSSKKKTLLDLSTPKKLSSIEVLSFIVWMIKKQFCLSLLRRGRMKRQAG